MNMRKEKGITLIALIMTIIVMLILVVVAISVVLNGNLFEKAEKAAKGTQVELDKEALIAKAVAAIDEETGKINTANLVLPDGWYKQGEKYVSAKGNAFTISEKGKIEQATLENISNPWTARGLSPNYQFGKWYGFDYDNNGELTKFLKFNEDGSYSQYNVEGENLREYTSEQIDQLISQGEGRIEDGGFVAPGQFMIKLNTDGTITFYYFEPGTEVVTRTTTLYIVEE